MYKYIKAIAMLILLSGSACAQNNQKVKTNLSEDTSRVMQTDSFWKSRLSKEQYAVLREKGTEKPFSGKWLFHEEKGFYTCAACGNPLFSSDRKFDSHCGWPSFDEEIAGGKIKTQIDYSHGMVREEIMCARCGGHLGHLFDDGPTSTGKRYCVNSLSLDFKTSVPEKVQALDTIVLGGGCFWCIEAVYEKMKGVVSAESGYAGGNTANPTYAEVCSGTTHHAEVVRVIYDRNICSLNQILEVFFTVHDPTTLNKQGADEGSQYRSIVLYNNQAQKDLVMKVIDELNGAEVYSSRIVTEVKPLLKFYGAEISHQDYYKINPDKAYCQLVVKPKVEKFESVFKNLTK